MPKKYDSLFPNSSTKKHEFTVYWSEKAGDGQIVERSRKFKNYERASGFAEGQRAIHGKARMDLTVWETSHYKNVEPPWKRPGPKP